MIPFLSDDWFIWMWKNYSIAILGIPSVLAFILKLLAIVHPGVPTDKIMDVVKEYWPKDKGGMKSQ